MRFAHHAAAAALILAFSDAQAQTRLIDRSDTLPAKSAPGHSMSARAADIDGDRDLDLLIAMEFAPNRLLLNDGRGRFADASDRLPPARRDSEEAVFADVDGDGDLDIIVANEDDLRPELYLNDGAARFRDASERLGVRVKANAVVAFDAEGDGDVDLFFGGDKVSHLLVGDGAGGFVDESALRLPDTYAGVQDVAAGDIDGDGDLDLALGAEDRNQLYLNQGDGRFALAAPGALPRPPAPEETRDVELFDADGDGDLDLFFANVALWNPRAVPQSRLLLNDGGGRFTDGTARWLAPLAESTLSATPIDLDGDGRLDLITTGLPSALGAGAADGPVRVWRNAGAAFEDVTAGALPAGFAAAGFDAVAADFDGDGVLDVFVASRGAPDRLLLSRPRP